MIAILQGDALEMLRTLPDESVQCCVTSPPYYGLRDYRHAEQIGHEESPTAFVAKLVAVFAEVRRVLKAEGVCWVNMGDSYASSWPCSRRSVVGSGSLENGKRENRPPRLGGDLKEKDLIGVPWMLAFALRADGWYLRQRITWCKPNGMPESVEDRPVCASEDVFLLSKSARYFYDNEAVRMPAAESSIARWNQFLEGQEGSARANGGSKTNGTMKSVQKQRGHSRRHDGFNDRWDSLSRDEQTASGRNLPNWWVIPPAQFAEAHFAVMPAGLARICILAGSRAGDTILDPFGGSGTTGMVALELGRKATLIELNPDYVKLIGKRTSVTMGLQFT